jgi:MOSC domain-containing protein YiiM
MQLLSVNVGALQALALGPETVRTGIFKEPAAGSVHIGALGLEGDAIGNLKHHGGPDQAVYIYSAVDAAFWSERLGRHLPHGFFGENLTVSDFGDTVPLVGDIWDIGSVRLQLTAPRIPCSKLAARVGDPKFLKPFVAENRGGLYARVLQEGRVEAGMSVRVLPWEGVRVPVDDIFALWHSKVKDPATLAAALEAPLAERARAALQHWSSQA